jgi:serine/threonine protein kinase
LFNSTVNYELLLQNKHCNIKHIDEDLSLYSPLIRNLLKQILTTDPKKRLSAEACLKHPWFAHEQPWIKASLSCNKIINDKTKSDRSTALTSLSCYIRRDRTPSPNQGAIMTGGFGPQPYGQGVEGGLDPGNN